MKNVVPISALIVASIFGFGFFSGKELKIQSPTDIAGAIFHSEKRDWIWINKVEEGKELLRNSGTLSYTYTKSRGRKQIQEKQIALAILDTLTGQVFEKRIWISQDDIKRSVTRDFEGINFIQDDSYNPLYPITIRIDWWNGFNSAYTIEPTNYVVVANKYLLNSTSIPNTKERADDDYTEIVYVPYSKYIHQEELIEEGKKYLDDIVDQAYRELERDRVISRGDPNQLVTSSAEKDWIKQIIVTEHMDPDLLSLSVDSGMSLAERVYIIIGTNKDRAYYYTSSSARARGISQFIRSTYDSMVRQYRQAGLIRDYRLGTSIHSNVVKAMVLLFDNNRDYLGDLLTRVSDDEVQLALAASYNGNPRWVRDSIRAYGTNWLAYQSRRRILRTETFGYINKLQAIILLDELWN